MITPRLLDLRRTRTRIFFWLGLLILPIFWIWWMKKRCFSRSERLIGWTWTAAYTATAVHFHQTLTDYITTYLSYGHPVVAIWLTLGLAIWLFGRNSSLGSTILHCIFLFLVLGPSLPRTINGLIIAVIQAGSPFHIWILPLIPALLHLLIPANPQSATTTR